MSLTENTYALQHFPSCESDFLTKIAQVVKACECSKKLMISIYQIDKNQFLYCNEALRSVVGGNLNNIFRDGWDFWYSLIDPKEVLSVKDQVSNFFDISYTKLLLTLRYHISDFYGKRIWMKHEILLHRLENHLLAINYFFDVTEKENIEHCFKATTDLNNSQPSNGNVLKISPREKEVLQLVGDGFSSKEIADMLFISNHTAISHRKNLIEKFQVRNTAHLIKRASKLIPYI